MVSYRLIIKCYLFIFFSFHKQDEISISKHKCAHINNTLYNEVRETKLQKQQCMSVRVNQSKMKTEISNAY